MSEWVEILWGFKKFYFKQMLKVSAFYLEKQKSFIPKHAKRDPKDGVGCPNFQWRFWVDPQARIYKGSIDGDSYYTM